MATKEARHVRLRNPSRCHAQNQLYERRVVSTDLDTVQVEEDKCRRRADALVPVHERMVLHQVVQVRGRHLEEIIVEVLPARTGLRHRQGVNIGPDSMAGHGIPSREIALAPGHVLHIDLGVRRDGYCSDIQRCWYLPEPGEPDVPDDVSRALDAVNAAITAGAEALRPGVEGWQVDAAGRAAIQERGYPEYQHALGHQVGRLAHDGGGILGPRWERYGQTPFLAVREGEIYTLELGAHVERRGIVGIEEMVRVTQDGCAWLTERQTTMRVLER